MKIEELVFEIEGQLEVVMNVCAVVIATHPSGERLAHAIEQIRATSEAVSSAEPESRAFARGIEKAVARFRAAIAASEAAARIRDLPAREGH